jgi:hypothetical protein
MRNLRDGQKEKEIKMGLLKLITAPIWLPFKAASVVGRSMKSQRQLSCWKSAKHMNYRRLDGKPRRMTYHGKKYLIRPVAIFEKDGYDNTYVVGKVGLFGKEKTFKASHMHYDK